ncbi:GntR family transcriptional regulator [Leifsonia xyli subsp. xyli]|uniref:Transcriptional regulator, GntR family n=2 Tax=Leifsonia xyli subsp. xyli TaxID=59736 RepID=Q6AHA0_LEIXX|nr:GntR family transcriptional regulator [Leifsonia xyli]AAT88245.1 transcriptional regulator, GntR family [Leifsonia xyli subsp. xyli str. CTCB07]ODA90344.1 GntR family transcriptional regulator [Leifsonia xyli subsp. xyli]
MPVPITEAVSPRRLIRDEVFERLLDAIVGGDLTPGEQLYDAEIEKWVGVSRTPVREALNQLAAMGLVEILPQKRTRVTPINPARLRGLIETTGTLLSGVARDATAFLTDADKQKLRDFQERISGGTDRLDRDRALTESFINVFVRRLDNKTIARLANRHLPEVRRALIVAPSSEAFEKAQPFVEPIVDAAIAGDGKTVAQGVADYWNKGLITVVDEFEAVERNS